MKKILVTVLCAILLIIITGCSDLKTQDKISQKDDVLNNKKSLVLYFSATNTTEEIAKNIAKLTESDITKIVPKEKYSSADLNYNDDDCRANKEQKNDASRPEIANEINVNDYELIYLGYPIWWGTNPKIILTLLDNYNFDGKDVALFCTSGGSGISQSVSDIKKYNDKINVIGSKRFDANASNSEIEDWLKEINE